MGIKIDLEKCTGCGDCISACSVEAIKIENNKAVLNSDDCLQCGICVSTCPEQAIEMS